MYRLFLATIKSRTEHSGLIRSIDKGGSFQTCQCDCGRRRKNVVFWLCGCGRLLMRRSLAAAGPSIFEGKSASPRRDSISGPRLTKGDFEQEKRDYKDHGRKIKLV